MMSNFDNSRWSDSRFAQEYRDQAEGCIPERRNLIEIAKSLYRHLAKRSPLRRILDLGCGDGLMVEELLKVDDSINATLVDGSQEMLIAAGNRLARFENKHLIKANFQDLLAQDLLPNAFNFVISSFAIHHLVMSEKEALFEYIYRHLDSGGFFLNIDVVLSPTDDLEKWYMMLWQEWIDTYAAISQKEALLKVPRKYKDNLDNTPDSLMKQLQALKTIGFENVDCYYKYGVFAMFGGSKAGDCAALNR
jgi:tRNA (cmo5U34)-methyltransferase